MLFSDTNVPTTRRLNHLLQSNEMDDVITAVTQWRLADRCSSIAALEFVSNYPDLFKLKGTPYNDYRDQGQ